ncbi:MAG TPA: NifB/NifX family molybdenum-iron cluster-binding protein [Anaerolineaceae bacterium]|jgi:predicted Fe-Mo cluster-binding NifX family protein|nr:hypothetical protein [Anaerolineaceae bacterium]NMD30715.1 dinitrogenase iron-molybdenum cofactor biosynthesis protein [Chloroflexota bacterium]HNS64437.1 NifB/NifX family molybdenum-iron cluster-binding protein [Anaerolineaceae bacterium]HNZ01058.1 NifB/NifX family molybdenum-iron cluster-binding protein [Anaerolineaceae bacterium]HOD43810.1 NifB/NifX family molybdenum-iron cluster-binding protein [Anaerolineaceae bacterium]
MKIAVVTDDGKTISQHFGRATHYYVAVIEDANIIATELREKPGHSQFAQEPSHEEHHHGHGGDAHSHGKHLRMAETIADCQVLICGGMGMGAYESLRGLNISVIVTDLVEIESAIRAYLSGNLVNLTERLH